MKIVSWNCNGGFRNKFHLLDDFGADVLVIQECEDPSKSVEPYKNWAKNYLWVGDNKNRGLGVFCCPEYSLLQHPWSSEELQMFLPCRINDEFNLVAVWTKMGNTKLQYIGQLWQYLQLHRAKLENDICAFIGDFNSNSRWDKRGRIWNHTEVVRRLDEIGLASGYHHIYQEGQGQETKPTFFLHRNIKKPYHIDYAFVPMALLKKGTAKFEIGNDSKWLLFSDHLPIFLNLQNSS
jgi:exonuclease III